MPELPEVETIRRGLAPRLEGVRLRGAKMRTARLRNPLDSKLETTLRGQIISQVQRRGKVLIFRLQKGALLVHLGMSGNLRFENQARKPGRHDHWDLLLPHRQVLRYRDPRRFGSLLATDQDPAIHPSLAHLGPEPLEDPNLGAHLHQVFQGRKAAVKTLLLDGRLIAGVGNIYASEALFGAGIRPGMAGRRLSGPKCFRLANSLQNVLRRALKAGGTTLQDHRNANGAWGQFGQELAVYGRKGLPCAHCGHPIQSRLLSGRNTFWCPQCQS